MRRPVAAACVALVALHLSLASWPCPPSGPAKVAAPHAAPAAGPHAVAHAGHHGPGPDVSLEAGHDHRLAEHDADSHAPVATWRTPCPCGCGQPPEAGSPGHRIDPLTLRVEAPVPAPDATAAASRPVARLPGAPSGLPEPVPRAV